MELHYSPLACSLAARIVCLEANLAVSLHRTELGAKDIVHLNPMGKVPTLVCDDGFVLTENVAVLLFLGDRAPGSGLTPPEGTHARYEVVKWLSFVATELHKKILATIFSLENPSDAVKDFARAHASLPLGVLDAHLKTRSMLVGDAFTVADAYLTWALMLMPRPPCDVSLDPHRAVAEYLARQMKRDAVRAAVRAEHREYQG